MDEIVRALKATADPNRLRILRTLGWGPFNVAELTEIVGVGQSTVSKHLKVLADARLVELRRAGTWSYYSLAGHGARPMANGSRPGPDATGREASVASASPASGGPRGRSAKYARSGFRDTLLDTVLSELGDRQNPDQFAIERVRARRRSATSEFFRENAPVWDDVRDELLGPPQHLGKLVHRVGPTGTVVDLGTGTGVLLESLGREAERVIGVDASPEMLERARERAGESRLANTDLRLGTLEHLPLSDGEADAMVANLVLHHVADLAGVFREVRRGLAPGGRLLIADLEEYDEESFWKALGAWWPGFRPEDVRARLESAGFEDVRWEHFPSEGTGEGPDAPGTTGTKEPDRASVRTRPPVFLMEARRAG